MRIPFQITSLGLTMVIAAAMGLTAQTSPAPLSSPTPASTPAPTPSPKPAIRTGVMHPGYNPKLPTLFLIGDSTVKNSWDTGTDGLWGWGRPLEAYFDRTKINIENQALGGTSSRSYFAAGHWGRVLALIKAGDFVIMQFGHNDSGPKGSLKGIGDETEKRPDPAGQEALVHTYGWYIKKYIADAKAKGATPIVCSLIPRNDWSEGKIRRPAGSYAAWAADAAKAGDALFIDLNTIISDRYDELGQEAVRPFFPKEHTHTGWEGALLNAQSVIDGIKANRNCALNKYLVAAPNPAATP